MKLYAFSGLGADERVFKFLSLNVEIIPLNWIVPKSNESISSYAKRMVEIIDTTKPFGIMGVSFGGLLCVEVNKLINPELTILISTVETSTDMPWFYRFFGKTQLIKLLPAGIFRIPRKLAHYLFGTEHKLLKEILIDSDSKFTKWALSELIVWKSNSRIDRSLKICGSNDKLLPPKNIPNTKIIKGGTHFMVVDKADEISEIINEKLRALKLC